MSFNNLSPQKLAQLALAKYREDADFITRQPYRQLRYIKYAVVEQVEKKVPQFEAYQGLLKFVSDQIAQRKKEQRKQTSWLTGILKSEKQHQQGGKQHGRQLYQYISELISTISRNKSSKTIDHGENIPFEDQQQIMYTKSQSVLSKMSDASECQKTKMQIVQRKAKLI